MRFLISLQVILLFQASLLTGQVPGNDKNWELDFADEFTDPDQFDSLYTPRVYSNSLIRGDCKPYCMQELQCYQKSNIEYENGILKLVAKKEPVIERLDIWQEESAILSDGKPNKRRFDYTSGAIMTNFKKPAGYFEISCKIPKGKGFWPAFWLHYHLGCDKGNEIDIFEPNGKASVSANSYGINLHYQYSEGTECKGASDGSLVMNLPDLSENFHKYSVEWSPGKLSYYFDDKLVNSIKNKYVPGHEMFIIADLAIDPWNPPGSHSFFPDALEIDYIRYYKLKMDCNAAVSPSEGENFNFADFDYRVKKSFSISNTSIPLGSKVTLRATDFIEFSRNFEVPDGTEFNAITVPAININY